MMLPLEFHPNLAAAGVLPLLVLFASASVLAIVVYRLHFHPLSKYPGPFWARITSFPSYWHTLRQDRHIWLWRLQEEYGKCRSSPRLSDPLEDRISDMNPHQARHFDTGRIASS